MNRRSTAIALSVLLLAVTAHGKVVTRPISYSHDGVTLEGHLAWDDAAPGKVPGILVVHEWWGLNDYARERAEKLAGLGYVAFALDMYGKGKTTDHPGQASEWMKAVNSNMDRWQQRALAGLKILKNVPNVDTGRLAAIGYCFGGATVQVLAYGGADLKAVVSFHGSLIKPDAGQAGATRAKILICHGAADPMVKPEDLTAYVAAMNAAGLDWQLIAYGGARHSFTNPEADSKNMDALAYSPPADRRSWMHMLSFFNEQF